jgi:ABC-type glycerol-3-phosphate transport system permease component
MIAWFVVVVAPLVWLTVTSLRTTDSYRASTLGWPDWAFSNFVEAWETAQFSTAVPNSIIYTLSIVACVVVLASLAGYGLARYRFRGRGLMMIGLVVAMTIPFSSIMFGVYDVVDALSLLGTRVGVVLPAVALSLPFATFYMRAFFVGIPDAIAEAARIDGAGELTIFVRVMLPLASPGIATLAVFSGVWSWAMYLEPLLLANTAALRPVALGLAFFTTEYGGSNQPLIAAAAVIIVLPLVLLSVLLQRRFVEGMTADAVK